MNSDNNSSQEQRTGDEDQLRSSTMNETIREVNGDTNMDLNDLKDSDQVSKSSNQMGSGGSQDSDLTQGMSYNPNDASAVRSGGTTDMDSQTSGGAGLNDGVRSGMGSTLTTKRNVTGSDFDGQDAFS
jgi:hypothetical protein